MPPTSTRKKFTCSIPGCTWGPNGTPASYDMPQHLGLHKRHKHGIVATSKAAKARAAKKAAKRTAMNHIVQDSVTRTRQPKPAPLSAEDICATVLTEVAPKGSIPVDAIGAYNEWVRQTETFLGKLLG